MPDAITLQRRLDPELTTAVGTAMARFAALFPYHAHSKTLKAGGEPSIALIREYAEALARWTPMQVANGALDLRAAAQHFPTPAEWADACRANARGTPVERAQSEFLGADGARYTPAPEIAAQRRALDAAIAAVADGVRRVVDLPDDPDAARSRVALLVGWVMGTMERRLRATIADADADDATRDRARRALASWMRYEFPDAATLAEAAVSIATSLPLPTRWADLGAVGGPTPTRRGVAA